MFSKIPIVLLFLISIISFFDQYIPLSVQSSLYAVSLTIKSLIIFFLPFIVFGLLFKTAISLANRASKMILFVLGAICLSNFNSTMMSYFVGNGIYQFEMAMHFPNTTIALHPAWEFQLPKWIGNGEAMLGGLGFGLLMGWLRPSLANVLSQHMEKGISHLLKGILYLIPLFIAGFLIKMSHDQLISEILQHYAPVFIVIALSVFSYISLIYYFTNGCVGEKCFISLKNMFPAALAGFGTMSSATAMPLTLIGAEKNANFPHIARALIPATVNIHLIGDCFAIPVFAFAILKGFGMEEPSFYNYLIFASFFVLAKFSVAAVPGGGILVMLPILEEYLNFNSEMLTLITSLYLLFDPVITCANVLGNGAFAKMADFLMTKQREYRANNFN